MRPPRRLRVLPLLLLTAVFGCESPTDSPPLTPTPPSDPPPPEQSTTGVPLEVLVFPSSDAYGNYRGGATDINDRGQALGYQVTGGSSGGFGSSGTTYRTLFIWEEGNAIRIGNWANAWVSAINDLGQVVGYFPVASAEYSQHAFLWEDGVMTDLGSAHSMATAINDLGQVVGYSGPSKYGPKRAFLWEDGIMTDLGTFGGTWSWARAINNLGQIVGDFWTDEHGYNYEHGFVWEDGIMTDLGSATKAFAINDPGQIVGYRTASNVGPRIAFLWEDGVMADLGEGIMPLAINNLGQVVGYRWVTGATRHAFLWEDGVMTDLGTLGSGNSFAYAINNLGQIAGTADNLPVIWSP